MDPWSSHATDSEHTTEAACPVRVLASTSGNVQPFMTDSKHYSDLKKPSIVSDPGTSSTACLPSLPILGSNDKSSVQSHSAARKGRRISQPLPDRPFLQDEKYKNYLKRKRKDLGKDGKPVWPDHIEASFQNALMRIPPMGRKKKTQYGRPHGRNELIAEWIYQDTGEIRDRKQVSSHIQFLSGRLKDVPEWKALIAKLEGESEDDKDESGCNYYYESIADQVRLERQLAQADKARLEEASWVDTASQRHSLSKLTFELWVGAPDNITHALHNYTRVANNHTSLQPVLLEDIDNWRSPFPNLEAILQSHTNDEFDVILVKSSFALMSDFPPKTSKLGLVLDLDFRNPGRESVKALSELKYWSSVNHVYLDGRPLRKTEHKECQSAEFGLVKPFFEADWWASQFTKLTYKKKEAENSMNNSMLVAADEYSRSLFRGLSIMQEIFASPVPERNSGLPRRRMAVLLWVFSQANKGQSGITSWQKIIPPPNRLAGNSPLAPPGMADSSLPPLILDSMVESSFDGMMTENDFGQHAIETGMPPFSPNIYEAGSYHSGFTPLQSMNNDHLKFYDFTNTGFTPRPANGSNNTTVHNDSHDSFSFDAPIEGIPSFPQTHLIPTNREHTSNVFDGLADCDIHAEGFSLSHTFRTHEAIAVGSSNRQQSLAKFDMSTHQMLQTQLSRTHNEYRPLSEDYANVSSDSQQTATGHMNNLEINSDEAGQAFMGASTIKEASSSQNLKGHDLAPPHASMFPSTKYSRPRLFPYNSFAGVTQHDSRIARERGDESHLDTLTRDDLARLVADQYENGHEDDLFGADESGDMESQLLISDNEIVRPCSHPVLPSNASPIAFTEDRSILEAQVHLLQDQTEVKARED